LALLRLDRCLRSSMKMPYHGICAAALVLLAGCQGSKPRMEAVASSDQLEPLWSMKVACDGGLRIAGQKVVLQRRSGGQYERWTENRII